MGVKSSPIFIPTRVLLFSPRRILLFSLLEDSLSCWRVAGLILFAHGLVLFSMLPGSGKLLVRGWGLLLRFHRGCRGVLNFSPGALTRFVASSTFVSARPDSFALDNPLGPIHCCAFCCLLGIDLF